MTIITQAQAIEALEQAVEANGPDFIYEAIQTERLGREVQACRYEDQGAPSCGVGLALSYLGVTLEILKSLDREVKDDTSINSLETLGLLSDAGFNLEPGAVAVFSKFQGLQDYHNPWGYSLDKAKEAAL